MTARPQPDAAKDLLASCMRDRGFWTAEVTRQADGSLTVAIGSISVTVAEPSEQIDHTTWATRAADQTISDLRRTL